MNRVSHIRRVPFCFFWTGSSKTLKHLMVFAMFQIFLVALLVEI